MNDIAPLDKTHWTQIKVKRVDNAVGVGDALIKRGYEKEDLIDRHDDGFKAFVYERIHSRVYVGIEESYGLVRFFLPANHPGTTRNTSDEAIKRTNYGNQKQVTITQGSFLSEIDFYLNPRPAAITVPQVRRWPRLWQAIFG